MNLLVLNNLYPPNAIGGYERLVAQVAAELQRRGHRVSVLTSDYGDQRPEHEGGAVERSLELLATRGNIYRPFPGSHTERQALNARNLQRLDEALRRVKPDAVLVGNLYFFDRGLLDGLGEVAARCVYLLTDVWMIDLFSSGFLADYMKRSIFELVPGTPSIVAADLPAARFQVEAVQQAADRAQASALELLARRRLEQTLSGGRAVYQVAGHCALCGPTSFLVRRAGGRTVMLAPCARTEARCARCGLDGARRGALQAARLVSGAPGAEATLLVSREAPVRCSLGRLFPAATVAAECDAGGAALRHAVLLDGTAGQRPETLRALLARLPESGGTVTAAEEPAGAAPELDLGAAARALGLEAGAFSYWSDQLGYLGRDHRVQVVGRSLRGSWTEPSLPAPAAVATPPGHPLRG